VVQKLLRRSRKGTRVTYIAGNHDEVVRQFLGLAFGGIEICDEAVHTMADGGRFLVVHGDLYDAVARKARSRGFQGAVCGHIHKPQIKTIDGVVYCNDGDWVESLSALVETLEGELKIVEWQRRLLPAPAPNIHDTEEEAHA
jgi:UDP-2,3-diacylglucosamine pyrophosphatase LpxH